MARVKIKVFDEKNERDSLAIYEIVTACLEGRPERYERGMRQSGNDGDFSTYRDVQTTSMICVQAESGEKHPSIILIVDKDKMDLLLQGVRESVYRTFNLEEISENRDK